MKATVLVVDDDRLMRAGICQILEREGYRVVQAEDGEAGLRRFREHPDALVVTDILMPGRDGVEMILAIRESHPHARILAISGGRRALTPDFNVRSAQLVGADATLTKPFERAELLARVRELQVPRER